MKEEPCRLFSLPRETLVDILSFLSVEDVLRVQQTSKTFSTVNQVRQIWYNLLRRLPVSQTPDLPPHVRLESISTEDLRLLVIRAVRSYRNWLRGPKLRATREYQIRITRNNESETYERVDPRLLPGGQYLVINNSGRLEIWSVPYRRRLWAAYEGPGENQDVISFDCELNEEAGSIMVAAVYVNRFASSHMIRVIRFDLERGSADYVLERAIPAVFLFRLMIRNDLVVVHLPHSFQIILMNWREGKCVILDFNDGTGIRLNARAALLASNYLIVALHIVTFWVIAVPLDALEGLWSASTRFSDWIHYTHTAQAPDLRESPEARRIIDDTIDRSFTLELPTFGVAEGPWVLALHCFQPTWRGPYAPIEIYIVAYGRTAIVEPINRRHNRFLSYRLHLSEKGEESTLTLAEATSSPAHNLPWNPHSISNAGRMFALRDVFAAYAAFYAAPQPVGVAHFDEMLMDGVTADVEEGTENVVNEDEQQLTFDTVTEDGWVLIMPEVAISAVEPWSGAVVIGVPGLVRIFNFD